MIHHFRFVDSSSGSKYIAASKNTTIAHTIEHLLVHFDLYSNIALAQFIT
jgi:hypothetical protein